MKTLKKILPFTGIIAAVLAIVTFILLMATPVAKYTNGSLSITADGTTGIFGKTEHTALGDVVTKAGWSCTLAWILVLVSIIALIAGVVLQLIVKKHQSIGGWIIVAAGIALIVAGIFAFTGKAVFLTANGTNADDVSKYSAAGWVVAGILAILAGAVSLVNWVLSLIKK